MFDKSSLIEFNDVITQFGPNRVHDGVSFKINQGEIFGLLGGSGAGKSTLLRQMIMLQTPTSGHISVLGQTLGTLSPSEIEALQLQWGVLFQFGALFSSLNVLENVSVTLKEYTKLPTEIIEDIAHTKIKMVGLPPHAAWLYPSELSGGMKKRVGLARALAMDPKLLFLDEPTSGLDPASARAFDHLIIELKYMLNLTIVMVTHDLESIEYALDRFIILHNKKVLIEGTMDEVKQLHNPVLDNFFITNK
ncbi:MAG: ATP-binding cassette domain-containing protein [gamma proteobacterium symbiont of Taylorina sp.]|nr:ATP-binding cassette domain-containing protein [gamma proteobacterium symbiont of Taylorina sp.]